MLPLPKNPIAGLGLWSFGLAYKAVYLISYHVLYCIVVLYIVSFRWYMFCLLVVLVKLSLLAK